MATGQLASLSRYFTLVDWAGAPDTMQACTSTPESKVPWLQGLGPTLVHERPAVHGMNLVHAHLCLKSRAELCLNWPGAEQPQALLVSQVNMC
jgi:hypothetical protein